MTTTSDMSFRIVNKRTNEHAIDRCPCRHPLSFERLEDRLTLNSVWEFEAGDYSEIVSRIWFEQFSQSNASLPRGLSGVEQSTDLRMEPLSRLDWVVRLTPESTKLVKTLGDANELITTVGRFQVVGGLGLPGLMLVESIGLAYESARDQLRTSSHIAYFHKNSTIDGQITRSNDPLLSQQIGIDAIEATAAWDVTHGSLNVVVGVIDTGIDTAHPDLHQNIWLNQGEIPARNLKNGMPLSRHEFELLGDLSSQFLIDFDGDGLVTFRDLNYEHELYGRVHENSGVVADLNENGYIDGQDLLSDIRWADRIDTDENGFPDDLIGWDFHNNDNDPTDDHRHGTHVAGIVGAMGNNEFGVAGVNWKTSMMPLKFLDENNQGLTSEAILAINYATMMRRDYRVNLRVTNNSWGQLGEFNLALRDTISAGGQQDILFVAAAGNGNLFGDGIDLDDTDEDRFYPASYDLDEIISVGALDPDGKLARFSNFGRHTVDIGAPGVGILSTELDGLEFDAAESRNGTSMAAPQVTGVAALLFAHQPESTSAEVRQAILLGASQNDDLVNKVTNGRSLNALGALNAETFGPQISVTGVSDIVNSQTARGILTLHLRDDEGVDLSTLDDTDLVISRSGFSDVQLEAQLIPDSLAEVVDPRDFSVQYEILPPDHPFDIPDDVWHPIDNGTYQVTLNFGEILEVNGISAGRRQLANFDVRIESQNVVFASADQDGMATIRAAVQTANTTQNATTIVVPDGVFPFAIANSENDDAASGDVDVFGQVRIIGAGIGRSVLDAQSIDRLFDVHDTAEFEIFGVTMTGGRANEGGAIRNSGGKVAVIRSRIQDSTARINGGAVWNDGELLIKESTLSNNSTTSPLSTGGGGIFNQGELIMDRSTLVGNSTSGGLLGLGGGAGIYNATSDETVSISNSTISQNLAINGNGAGMFHADGHATITHLTVTENQAEFGEAGGIFVFPACIDTCEFNAVNSIVANNMAFGENDVSGVFHSNGANLIGILGSATGFENDLFGSPINPLDPILGPLRDNGGPTNTHAPLNGSPAVNAATSVGLTDQRGIARPADSSLVADLQQHSGLSVFGTPVNMNGRLFFSADDGRFGPELWTSDLQFKETARVLDIRSGREGSTPQELTLFAGELYFRANDGVNGTTLWKSDGTALGTVPVVDAPFGSGFSSPQHLTVVGEMLFYSGWSEGSGRQVWKTDGTEIGTEQVTNFGQDFDPAELIEFSGKLYFTADDGISGRELWTSNGTAAGTNQVFDIQPGPAGSVPEELTVAAETIFFRADDGITGVELWMSDGSPNNTKQVKDIYNFLDLNLGSNPQSLTEFGEELFFIAESLLSDLGLWKSDGTEDGTVRLADIRGVESTELTVLGDLLFFTSDDGETGVELWKTDGSRPGTVLVADLREGASGSHPSELATLDNQLFFVANDGQTGINLWKSDGTSAGTRPVADIQPGIVGANPEGFRSVGEAMLFQVPGLHENFDITIQYRSSQNQVSPVLISNGGTNGSSAPRELTLFDNALLFTAFRDVDGRELWTTDGTERGTASLGLDLGIRPREFTTFNDEIYFSTNDSNFGRELWKTNGTQEGTRLVADVRPGVLGSFPTALTVYRDRLYFAADDGQRGSELWSTDGTLAGTRRHTDINPGPTHSFPNWLTVSSGELYFTIDRIFGGGELWVTDGTFSGTRQVAGSLQGEPPLDPEHLASFNGELYFSARGRDIGHELWKTDGTRAGTRPLMDIRPGPGPSYPREFSVLGEELLFSASDSLGTELWKTDGTGNGTVRVADIHSGPSGSNPRHLTVFGDDLYFAADDGIVGRELWKTDGTPEGTVLAADIQIGTGSSVPAELTPFGQNLYYRADDGMTGEELHVLTPSQSIGAVQKLFGEISGEVFHDIDHDGRRDPNEPGLAGWMIRIADGINTTDIVTQGTPSDDPATPSTETGQFIVDGLFPGDYSLQPVVPTGYEMTFPIGLTSEQPLELTEIIDSTADGAGEWSHFDLFPSIVGSRVVFQVGALQIYLSDLSRATLQPLFEVATEGIVEFTSPITFSGAFAAFSALDRDRTQGVFLVDRFGKVSRVVDASTLFPDVLEPRDASLHVEALVDELVAFSIRSEETRLAEAIYVITRDRVPVVLADTRTSVPEHNTTFRDFTAVRLDGSSFALHGSFGNAEETGIYLGDGTGPLLPVVDTSTAIPRGTGNFSRFGSFSFSANRVAFRGIGEQRQIGNLPVPQDGIYLRDVTGFLSIVADTTTLIPYGDSTFVSFGGVAQDQDNTVFVGHGLDGQQGIYAAFGDGLKKVVDLDDVDLFGGKVPIEFQIGDEAISGNQIVFHATFSDDSQAIYVASFSTSNANRVSLRAAEIVTDIAFGVSAFPGEIHGRKFEDANANLQRDEGEAGLSNWSIFIDENENGLLDVGESFTETDALGNYRFTDLPALTHYTVSVVAQEGWARTIPSTIDGAQRVFLEAAEIKQNIDFGSRRTDQVGGVGGNGRINVRVFEDTNGNGMQDAGEAGLPGQRIYLDLNDNGRQNGNETVHQTDENGQFTFANLAPRAYSVRLFHDDLSVRQTSPKGNSFTRLDFDIDDIPAAVALAQTAPDSPPQLIIARNEANQVSLLRDPLGTRSTTSVRVGASPAAIVVADFDSDGIEDSAVANEGADNLSIVLFDRTYNPETFTFLPVGDGPRALAAGDIDNDGDIDLAVAHGGSNDVIILLNDGNANFSQSDRLQNVGASPSGIELVHLNAGRSIDIAVSLRDSDRVAFFRNDGQGQFSNMGRIDVVTQPVALTAVQLNDDGIPDFAVVGLGDGRVTTLLTSSQTGPIRDRFARKDYFVGMGPTSIVATDIDLDGDQDLIVAVGEGNLGSVSLLRNIGNGEFQGSESAGSAVFRFASAPLAIESGDFDEDNDIDLAIANGVAGGVTVLQNDIVNNGSLRVSLTDQRVANGSFGLQPINRTPTIDEIRDVTIDEDTPTEILLTGISAGGNESQSLNLRAFADPSDLLEELRVVHMTQQDSAILTIRPAENRFGVANVRIELRAEGHDGILDTQDDNLHEVSFAITVLPVNDIPRASDDEYTIPGGARDFVLDLLSNDFDPDPDQELIIFRHSLSPEIGTIQNSEGKILSLTLSPAATGTHRFSYYVQDTSAEQSDATAFVTLIIDGVFGDFDQDSALTTADIDMLARAINDFSTDSRFDLNYDNQIDFDDLYTWVKDIRRTHFGDANLDGEFNSRDLIAIFSSARFESGVAASWAEGDWNADGEFNTSDLIVSFADGGFEQGPVAAGIRSQESALEPLVFSIGLRKRLR